LLGRAFVFDRRATPPAPLLLLLRLLCAEPLPLWAAAAAATTRDPKLVRQRKMALQAARQPKP
jgi:hypothetical protein